MADRIRTPGEVAEAVAALRKLLVSEEEQGQSDSTLARFLVAREFKLDKAHEMLTSTLKWRREQKVDEMVLPPAGPLLLPVRGYDVVPDSDLSEDVPDEFKKVLCTISGGCFHKQDKLGGPIFIERVGLHDAKKIAQKLDVDTMLRFHILNNEFLFNVLMDECSKKSGKTVEKMTVIFDLQGLGFHQFVMPALNILKAISQIDQDYYPERMQRLFLVNAPKIFVAFWGVLSPWLDKGLLDKIKILGEDYKETLLEFIDADNLPKYLGGNCECAHMKGGCVPVKYYDEKFIKKVLLDPNTFDEDAELVDKEPMRVEVAVEKAGSKVSWQFKTNKYPCAFVASFIPVDGYDAKPVEIAPEVVEAASDVIPAGQIAYPKEICESNKRTFFGSYVAEKPGTIILQWENIKKAIAFMSGYGARMVSYSVFVDDA